MLLVLVAATCGPTLGATGMSGSGSETGADESTSATTGSSAPTTGDASTTGPLVCEYPTNEITGPEVTVTLRNAGVAAIFVGSNDIVCQLQDVLVLSRLLELHDADDERLELDPWLDGCETRCDELIAGQCGCDDTCQDPRTLQLDPGGSVKLRWSGVYAVPVDLSPGCFGGECGLWESGHCMAPVQAVPASYQFVAFGHTELSCAKCTCMANPDGWCEVDYWGPSGLELIARTSFDYPGTTAVEVVFP